MAGANAPAAEGHVIVDIDDVLVLAHSQKQDATPTWKKTFGHHPLVAFVDHGQTGSPEPVAALLRRGHRTLFRVRSAMARAASAGSGSGR